MRWVGSTCDAWGATNPEAGTRRSLIQTIQMGVGGFGSSLTGVSLRQELGAGKGLGFRMQAVELTDNHLRGRCRGGIFAPVSATSCIFAHFISLVKVHHKIDPGGQRPIQDQRCTGHRLHLDGECVVNAGMERC